MLSDVCFRAASAQQQLEGSVNGLKKETGAQLRELASDRGEALRALEGAKQAAEHRQHQLQVHIASPPPLNHPHSPTRTLIPAPAIQSPCTTFTL